MRYFNKGALSENKGALLRNKGALLENKEPLSRRVFLLGLQIVFAVILATQGQLVVLQIGQHLLQLEEEAFARLVAVGKHVKFS